MTTRSLDRCRLLCDPVLFSEVRTMSVQAVQQFLQAADTDLDLKQKLRQAKDPNRTTTLANIVNLAATIGLTFTAAEYEAEVASELSAVFENHRAIFHH